MLKSSITGMINLFDKFYKECDIHSDKWIDNAVLLSFYLKVSFGGLRYLQRFIAKDIQSRCRNLREMMDVFKELKVLVEKGKVALHKLTKIYWKRFNNIYKHVE